MQFLATYVKRTCPASINLAGHNNQTYITMPTATKTIPELTEKNKRNFWRKVDKMNGPKMPHMETRCWQWTGAGVNSGKYGRFNLGGKEYSPHRISFVIAGGILEDGMLACHKCDHPTCVNPAHLFSGTHSDNARDSMEKGRSAMGERHWLRKHPERATRGEKSGSAKLTEESVREIRIKFAVHRITKKELGLQFGVTTANIHRIVTRQTWAHIEENRELERLKQQTK